METKTGWNSPICICLIAASFGLFGNMATTVFQIRSNQRLAYERRQADLIMQATKDQDVQHAKENLRFLVNAGLLDDPRGVLGENLLHGIYVTDKGQPQFFHSPD